MKKLMFILMLLVASASLFSQEYEIAWEKDIGGTYAQFSKDGEFIYVAKGNIIQKYRSSDGSFVSTFDGTGFPIANIYQNFFISSSGNYILAVSNVDNKENLLYIWDTKTEKVSKVIEKISDADFISDDSKIYYCTLLDNYNYINVYDFNLNKKLNSIDVNGAIHLIKLSHNGKFMAIALKNSNKYYLTLWDTETLTEIKRFDLVGYSGATFIEVKFSLDDSFVGVRTYSPWDANIFNTKTFEKTVSSVDLRKLECFGFDFTSSNKFCFFYLDIMLYIYNKDLITIDSTFKLKASPLITSSNNLIFTGKALLKPKSVDVSEPIQKNLSITNIKDLLIIENKSEINEIINIKIFDLQGKEVYRNSLFLFFGSNKFIVPKSILNGSYIFQISSNSINISQKIMIQR